MQIELEAALDRFRATMVGQYVRGQKVDGVELLIDDNSPGRKWRYFLHVVFQENPHEPGASEEMNLIRSVFSEIPTYAVIRVDDIDELKLRLIGYKACLAEEWRLEDEVYSA